jgi:hypothetical protein
LKKLIPIIILLILNVVIGTLVFRDFGESWDEESMHYYADISYKAYQNIANPNSLESYYGDNILRYYGPAYVLMAKTVINFFPIINQIDTVNVWHLLNFLTFQIGILFFYLVCVRYQKPLVATATTLLFNTQPVIWGHSFINPRDIPLLVFFIATISSGLYLSDVLPSRVNDIPLQGKFLLTNKISINNIFRLICLKVKSNILQLIFLIISLIVINKFQVLEPIIGYFIKLAYYSGNTSLVGCVFSIFSENYRNIPLENFIVKGTTITNYIINTIIIILFLIDTFDFFRYFNIGLISKFSSIVLKRFHILDFKKFYDLNKSKISPKKTWSTFGLFVKNFIGNFSKWQIWLASLMFGFCISTRIVGIYAGFLVVIFLLITNLRKSTSLICSYLFLSLIFTYLLWPYLWFDPIHRFIESLTIMSNFQWDEKILFAGNYFKVDSLPRSYFPTLLGIQITEPALLLIILGILFYIYEFIKNKSFSIYSLIEVSWFSFPALYIILKQPPIYDNFRHFLFIIPPLFLIAGKTIQMLSSKTKPAVFSLIILLLALPGIYQIYKLHPYSYVYYNSLIGGINGADGNYELDYFGTSLKEVTERINYLAPTSADVYVSAPLHLVKKYIRDDINLLTDLNEVLPNQLTYEIFLNRFNWPEKFKDKPEIFTVQKNGTVFSGIRIISFKEIDY